jgi:DUF4097 and DUF4098 domain-containing protein YvlB
MKVGKWNPLLLAACFEIALILGSAMPSAAAAEGSFQRTLQVGGPVSLEIETGSGNVDVQTGSSNQVQITGHIRATKWFGDDDEARVQRIEANPPIQQSGNDIRVGHISDPELRRNISISYEVIVPPQTRLQSHTGSGSQRIEGVRGMVEITAGSGNLTASDIGDTVRAETGSGSIELDGVKGNVRAQAGSGSIRANDVAGGFEGHTGSGHITLSQSSPGAVRAETGSGGLDLRGVQGSLEATAGSGTIDAQGNPTGAWTVHTGSGTVHLKFVSDASFDLHAHTGSGSMSVRQPLTVQGALGRKDIQGKVRGGGVPVDVETGSGSIEIE